LEIQRHILSLKGNCGDILAYDWINLPLAYTQVYVVTIQRDHQNKMNCQIDDSTADSQYLDR
jgi:hypothetical protein